jgi:hypothetical protein
MDISAGSTGFQSLASTGEVAEAIRQIIKRGNKRERGDFITILPFIG